MFSLVWNCQLYFKIIHYNASVANSYSTGKLTAKPSLSPAAVQLLVFETFLGCLGSCLHESLSVAQQSPDSNPERLENGVNHQSSSDLMEPDIATQTKKYSQISFYICGLLKLKSALSFGGF